MMHTKFRHLLLLTLLAGCEQTYADWSASDTKRQATYYILHIIDWGQTRYIAKHSNYYETNGILGKNPSIGEINRYFIVTGLLHFGIARYLSPKWRARFQYVTIGVQTGFVVHNRSLGIRIDF